MIYEGNARSVAVVKTQDRQATAISSEQTTQPMLRLNRIILAGFAFMILAFAAFNQAGAVEPLSSAELESHCAHYRSDPEGKDGIFCVRYLQGFIDGAVATDERVTLNVAEEYEKEETYSERAIRTRLGKRMENYGPSYYAEFCLGDPVPKEEVVEKVVTVLKQPGIIAKTPLARDVVYQALRTHYPCES